MNMDITDLEYLAILNRMELTGGISKHGLRIGSVGEKSGAALTRQTPARKVVTGFRTG